MVCWSISGGNKILKGEGFLVRKIIGLFLILCIAFCCSGCKSEQFAVFAVPSSFETVNSGVLAENSRYILTWDDETKCIFLQEKISGIIWSTIPYNVYKRGDISYSLSSLVSIEYYNTADGSVQMLKSADCVDDGTTAADIIENGIAITWYFKEAEISFTTECILREDSLLVSLPAESIVEGQSSRLLNVSLTPYLCATENTDSKQDYLFIPSGCGALMYTDEETNSSRKYEEEVYGTDPVKTVLDYSGKEEAIRLPVFGVKSGDMALCGIIEENDGAAKISAVAGDSRTHYSTVYATFNIRGYNMVEHGNSDTVLLAKSRPETGNFSVGYYPISGERADYNGMADCYRNYLAGNNMLEKSSQSQKIFHLSLIGGELTEEYTLGIPHNTLLKLTSFSDAESIVSELVNSANMQCELSIQGFDADFQKIAGGYGYSGKLGGKSGKASLENFCKKKGIPLYTDFDIIHFAKSGNGFNKLLDSALTANSQTAVIYPIKINVGTENTEEKKTYLLKRRMLSEAIDRLLDFVENDCSGISLNSLGNTAYSDYSQDEYSLKGSVAQQTNSLLKKVKKKHSLHLSSANGYCVGIADSVSDVPLQNGGYNSLDATIPFYSMVFRGYTSMYSTAVNLSTDSTKQLLRAVEAGVFPSFKLCRNIGTQTAYLTGNQYYGLSYENNLELICKTVEKFYDYYDSTVGVTISSHRIVCDGVTETVFENGVRVLVNHTDKAEEYSNLCLPAKDFLLIGE